MQIGFTYKNANRLGFGLTLSALMSIIITMCSNYQLQMAEHDRFHSTELANELQQSSRDLTMNARTFVVTGDAQFERKYWDIVDVRSGKRARPDGRKIALKSLMKEAGFTEYELSKLTEAEARSDALIKTEELAMNTVKGLFPDGSGQFNLKSLPNLLLAQRLMHDQAYHDQIEIIMKPLRDFEKALNQRTRERVGTLRFRAICLQVLSFILVCAIFVNFIVSNRFLKLTLKNANAQLNSIAGQASGMMKTLESMAKELSRNAGAESSSLTQTVAAVAQTSTTINRNSTSATRTASSTAESRDSALRGKAATENVAILMSEIDRSNQDIMTQVRKNNIRLSGIASLIREIGSKTKMINEIVFKTKLLSFNAAVEAARAGDQGKGFGVVAEEIGNLAHISGHAAKEIGMILEQSVETVELIIEETTEKIDTLIHQGKLRMDEGMAASKECARLLDEVVTRINSINVMAHEIADASHEQTTGMSEISRAMEAIDCAAQANASASKQMADITSQLKAESDRIQDLTETMNHLLAA